MAFPSALDGFYNQEYVSNQETVDIGSNNRAKRVILYDTSGNVVLGAIRTDAIYNGSTSLEPKFAFANVAASQTDSQIVAAVASKKIRVISYRIHTAATATNVTFNTKPAGAGSAISELFALGVNGGRAEGFNPVGHFQTNTGEGLTVTTGSGSTTGIGVVYVEV